MDSKITALDVAKAKALLANYKRQKDAQKRKLKKPVSRDQATKAIGTIGHFTEQQGKKAIKVAGAKAKKIAKSGASKFTKWLNKK